MPTTVEEVNLSIKLSVIIVVLSMILAYLTLLSIYHGRYTVKKGAILAFFFLSTGIIATFFIGYLIFAFK